MDIAIAASISNNLKDDIEAYLDSEKLSIKKVYHCMLSSIGKNSVIDGKHAWLIAEQLNDIIGRRVVNERQGVIILHVDFQWNRKYKHDTGQCQSLFYRFVFLNI